MTSAADLWANDEVVYILDTFDNHIHCWRYDKRGKRFVPAGQRHVFEDVTRADLRGAHVYNPHGVWSDGVTMWVSN